MLLLLLGLFFSAVPIFAQEASPSAIILPTESPSSTTSATISPPNPTDSPTSTPSATIIPTPTTDPNITLFFEYSQDYNDWLFIYQQDYLNYTDKVNIHTRYGTITTLKDKIEATKKVMLSRNNLLRSYLTALRVKLKIYQTEDLTNSQSVGIEINKWEDWLNEQNSIVDSLNNVEDIKSFTGEFKTKYRLIQQAVYTGLVQNEINLRLHTLDLVNLLKEGILNHPSIKAESREWISSITVKTDLVTSNLQEAFNITQKNLIGTNFVNFYPSSKERLSNANTYLLEMRNNLESIVIKFIGI